MMLCSDCSFVLIDDTPTLGRQNGAKVTQMWRFVFARKPLEQWT
jgi:hypothetical protein